MREATPRLYRWSPLASTFRLPRITPLGCDKSPQLGFPIESGLRSDDLVRTVSATAIPADPLREGLCHESLGGFVSLDYY